MSHQLYTLDQNGQKVILEVKDSILIDFDNGTTLELLINNLPANRENCLSIHSRVTGEGVDENVDDSHFATLSIEPAAANVIGISANLHARKNAP
ncbi:hypothetical protein EOPP23_05455 [Endozoicomonas sp. OPT23]|uniref:hypothetical protein n=1 Tax=Endozoicomonas sp. OPT23 TaxID=2072845 RepID=UPI00129B2B6A|nr:hypothetical protein [Endozoicomonas sp. OPT23]MRI32430.1 hypothetical protein [Endozoicomonas sp. OPT23]